MLLSLTWLTSRQPRNTAMMEIYAMRSHLYTKGFKKKITNDCNQLVRQFGGHVPSKVLITELALSHRINMHYL